MATDEIELTLEGLRSRRVLELFTIIRFKDPELWKRIVEFSQSPMWLEHKCIGTDSRVLDEEPTRKCL